MADQRYEQAITLHRQRRCEQARALLADLVAEEPSNMAARFALGTCLIDLNRPTEARKQLTTVLAAYPRHHRAAYLLGRVHEQQGDPTRAADYYRRAAANEPGYRDAAARLATLETTSSPTGPFPPEAPATTSAAVPHPTAPTTAVAAPRNEPVSGDVLPPGVAPLRHMLDAAHIADLGALRRSCHLQARYLAPWVVGALALAVILPLLPGLFAGLAGRYDDTSMAHDIDEFFATPPASDALGIAVLLAWVVLLPASVLSMMLQARLNRVEFHDHGMEVSGGVLRRTHQVIWYYQITEAPIAERGPQEYLTGTTTLTISYNVTASTTQRLELQGIGNPAQVAEVRRFLQSRVPPERWKIRGAWT